MRAFRGLAFLAMGLAMGLTAAAQAVSTAQIAGVIQDSSGSAVPGAAVKVTQSDTGAVRTATSGPAGAYLIPSLPVGPYTLEVSKDGFATYVQSGIVLQVASNPTIDVSLKVGAVAEQVQVEANATMVETQTTGVGTVIDSQRVLNLPLVGRQVQDLITLAGGASQASDTTQLSARNYPGIQSLSVAGGLATGITYVLDGAMHNDVYTMANLPLPFPDALQEFKVETGSLPAQYGMHSAAAVNAVTKSGTNDFHGSAFEFVRNYKFNARNYFSSTLDSLKRNQFGGTFGGPIRKNRMFFFGAYQQTATRQSPNNLQAFVPTAAELRGDFRAYASAQCQATPITLKAPFGTGGFAPNTVNPALLSAPALAIAAKLPASGDPCGRTTYGPITRDDEHFGVGRFDYQLSPTHSVFVRYLGTQDAQPVPYSLSATPNLLTTGNGGVGGSSSGIDDFAQVGTIGDTYLIGNATVNSFRATFSRVAVTKLGASFFGPQQVGINIFSPFKDFTSVAVNNAFSIGNNLSTGSQLRTSALNFSDDIGIVRGKHQMGFGAAITGWDSNVNGNVFAIGVFTFNGSMTGRSLADYMLGSVATLAQSGPNTTYIRDKYFGLYGQDSWKIKPGLTINYGLRWEPYFPQTVPNSQIYHFDLSAYLAGTTTTVYKNAPPGLFYPGDPGFPGKAGMNKQWKQFLPRVGIVWDPKGDGKMSVRASYGIAYDTIPSEYHLNTTTAPPFSARTTLNNVNFANPYANQPGGNPFPYVLNPNSPIYTPFGQFNNWNYDFHMPYVESWTLSVQRQFAKDWLATVSYLGSEMTHLNGADAQNPAVFLGNTPTCTVGSLTITQCNTTASTNTRRLLNLLNPAAGKFFGFMTKGDDGGTGSYQGLLLSAQRRYSRGITASANYTWSHCIGNPVNNQPNADNNVYLFNNRAQDRGNCNTSGSDHRHIANMTAVAEMPRFSDRWTNRVVSGWRASATATLQSGGFMTVYTGVDQALTGVSTTGAQRANQVLPNTAPTAATVSIGVSVPWINPKAYALPPLGSYGNSGIGSLEGPGLLMFNTGLSRLFNIRERQTLEARAEAQNVLNHANFANPNAVVTSPTFGLITSTAAGNAGNARVFQFGLKYIF